MIRRHKAARINDCGGAVASTVLPVCPPCDWPALFAFLASRAIPGVEHVTDRIWRRSFALHDRIGTVEAVVDRGSDTIAFSTRPADAAEWPEVARRLARVFDTAAEPQAVAEALSRDPLLARRVAARPGLRVAGAWDAFELAVRAILGQQITVVGASQLAGKLVSAFGERLPEALALPSVTHLFPTPERLATSDVAALGLPRARAAAIRGLGAAVAAEPGLLQPTGSLEADVARLCRLPGIGAWTAQYIAMRALRHADAFPAADIGLLRAATAAGGARPTPAWLLTRAESWRPFRAYAAMYLWTGSPDTPCA